MSRMLRSAAVRTHVRVLAPILAVCAALAAVATLVVGLTIPSTGTTVVASGRPGQPISLSRDDIAAGTLYVLASRPGDRSTDTNDGCMLDGGGLASFTVSGPEVTRDGRLFRPFSQVTRWSEGSKLSCEGPNLSALLVVTQNRTSRILLTLGLGAIAVVGSVLAAGGIALMRRPRPSYRPVR